MVLKDTFDKAKLYSTGRILGNSLDIVISLIYQASQAHLEQVWYLTVSTDFAPRYLFQDNSPERPWGLSCLDI